MKYGLVGGSALLAWVLSATTLMAAEPYIQLEAGILGRDVVEEDPSIVGLSFEGDAASTRITAKVGVELWKTLNLYVQGGGADLTIDEFNGYDAGLEGIYGGGVRLNIYRSPFRDQVTLFVEGTALRFTTDDRVEIEMKCTTNNDCPNNTGAFLPRLADEEIQWNEYTVLLGASGRMVGFDLYGGIRLSRVDGKDRIRANPDANFSSEFRITADLEEDDNFGIFGGVDIFLDRSENTALNFEVSLIDQDSFRAAIRRKF